MITQKMASFLSQSEYFDLKLTVLSSYLGALVQKMYHAKAREKDT